MHWMVPNGKRVNHCPQSPPAPFPDVCLGGPEDDQCDKVAYYSEEDSESTGVGPVAEDGEEKDDWEGDKWAD